MWSATATAEHTLGYRMHLTTKVLPALRELDGYEGAFLLERLGDESVELIVVTWWKSLDAIRGFAGDALEAAVVADEAATLLIRFDRHIKHYDLALIDNPEIKEG